MALTTLASTAKRLTPARVRSTLRRAAPLAYVAPTSLLACDRAASGRADGEIRVRRVPDATFFLRAGTSDANVADSTFRHRLHLPEWPLPRNALIWDLGANIGLTAADLAIEYPDASIVAVELDAGNVEVARRNTAHLGDRCEVIHAGVWVDDEPVRYAETTTQGFGIGGTGGREIVAPGLSPNTLMDRGRGRRVAFAKIDIEGAERRILYTNTAWTEHVDSMKIEMHGRDMARVTMDMIAQLRRLGFEAGPSKAYRAAVIARRPATATQV